MSVKGIVLFAPGLRGVNSFKKPESDVPDPASNEYAVNKAARKLGWEFHKANYQNISWQTPTLSVMEGNFALQFERLQKAHPGTPVLIAGSSVGFGVVLGGLSLLESTSSPIALLGYKPIPDPLHAIQLQIGHAHPGALEALKAGHIPAIPMPVEGAEPDIFPLTKDHIEDPDALRLLTEQYSRDKFNHNAGGHLRECIVLYGNNDHLTPRSHMQQFCDAVSAVPPLAVPLDGGHGADLRAMLTQVTADMMYRLGSPEFLGP